MTTNKLTVTEARQALLDKINEARSEAQKSLKELDQGGLDKHYRRFEGCCNTLEEALRSLVAFDIAGMELPCH